MGTEIELKVGNVRLDYAKNWMGSDYGYLYQVGDLTRRHSDAIDYEYYAKHPDDAADLDDFEKAFVRPLRHVVPRLNLLGHTLEAARQEYQASVAYAVSLSEYSDAPENSDSFATFEEFCALANRYPLNTLASEFVEFDTEDRRTVAQGRFAAHGLDFARLPTTGSSDMYWSESSYLAANVAILTAPSMLQVFASNPENNDVEVVWQFGPIVHAGWVDADSFKTGAGRSQTVLIATEGASDAHILRRALDLLRPDVADFFRFIDCSERHHFWGTGNLVKFAEGLLRIDIQNQVLFVFDNDAEGVDAFRKLQGLRMTGNMRSMLLPDLDELRNFPTLGPEGMNRSDINGRAAAIECYLDLRLSQFPPAKVIWSNYKKEIDAWHGALEYKDSYSQHFLAQEPTSLSNGTYDTTKLSKLLDALIAEASLLVVGEA